MSGPVSEEGMVFVRFCKIIPFGKDVYDVFKLLGILSSFDGLLDCLLELAGCSNGVFI
jgi:hypothetical protein